MRLAVDCSGIVLLLVLGIVLLVWTRPVQRATVRLLRRMPRWILGPVPPSYYESSLFIWCMRWVGLGCIVGALRIGAWALEAR